MEGVTDARVDLHVIVDAVAVQDPLQPGPGEVPHRFGHGRRSRPPPGRPSRAGPRRFSAAPRSCAPRLYPCPAARTTANPPPLSANNDVYPMCPVQPGWPCLARTGWRRRHRRQDPGPGRCPRMADTDTAELAAPGVKIRCHLEIPRTCQPFRLRAQIRRHADGVANHHDTRPGPGDYWQASPGSRTIAAGSCGSRFPRSPSWFAVRRGEKPSRGFAGPPAAGILRESSITGPKRSITGRYRDLSACGVGSGGHVGARARTVPGNRYDYGARDQTRPGRCWHARRGPEPAFALATAGSKSASCPGFTGGSACSKIMSASSPQVSGLVRTATGARSCRIPVVILEVRPIAGPAG